MDKGLKQRILGMLIGIALLVVGIVILLSIVGLLALAGIAILVLENIYLITGPQ